MKVLIEELNKRYTFQGGLALWRPNVEFRFAASYDGVECRISAYVPSVANGDCTVPVWGTRNLQLPVGNTPLPHDLLLRRIDDQVFVHLQDLLRHELMESLLANGKQVYDPHPELTTQKKAG